MGMGISVSYLWRSGTVGLLLDTVSRSRITHNHAVGELAQRVPTAVVPSEVQVSNASARPGFEQISSSPSPDSPLYPLWVYAQTLNTTTPSTDFTRIEVQFGLRRGYHVLNLGLTDNAFVRVLFHWEIGSPRNRSPYGIYDLDLNTGNFVHFDLCDNGRRYDANIYPWMGQRNGDTYLDYVAATANAIKFVAEDSTAHGFQQAMLSVATKIEENIRPLQGVTLFEEGRRVVDVPKEKIFPDEILDGTRIDLLPCYGARQIERGRLAIFQTTLLPVEERKCPTIIVSNYDDLATLYARIFPTIQNELGESSLVRRNGWKMNLIFGREIKPAFAEGEEEIVRRVIEGNDPMRLASLLHKNGVIFTGQTLIVPDLGYPLGVSCKPETRRAMLDEQERLLCLIGGQLNRDPALIWSLENMSYFYGRWEEGKDNLWLDTWHASFSGSRMFLGEYSHCGILDCQTLSRSFPVL